MTRYAHHPNCLANVVNLTKEAALREYENTAGELKQNYPNRPVHTHQKI